MSSAKNKFQNKYRIASVRLQKWDYRWNAAYFVTICTQQRDCFFGEIVNEKMKLSETGQLAQFYWCEIPNHFPFVQLGDYVIMPNHIHGIIIIDQPNNGRWNGQNDGRCDKQNDVCCHGQNDERCGGHCDGQYVETPKLGVSTTPPNATPSNTINPNAIPPNTTIPQNNCVTAAASEKWKPASLGVIINQYKRIVTINARKIQTNFAWQSRYYDHIIRNDGAFQRISDYINNNPRKWQNDKFYFK
jgi:REP element-mobilizing transposase RayT